MIDKVRALLRKAESTTFEAEAEALTAKAQELMARLGIESVEAEEIIGPVSRRVDLPAPHAQAKALLLDRVAQANRCRMVWSEGYGTLFGYPSDVEGCELLYQSLIIQGTKAMMRAARSRRQYGRADTPAFRDSFLIAYAERIGERLSAVVAGLDLPVRWMGAVEKAVQDSYPDLTTTQVQIPSREGWTSGTQAADRADVG